MIAGIRPDETIEIRDRSAEAVLRTINEKLTGDLAAIFTLSYDFGRKLQAVDAESVATDESEPDLFLSTFKALIIHDYDTGRTDIVGHRDASHEVAEVIKDVVRAGTDIPSAPDSGTTKATSNYNRSQYTAAVERIREYIRCGDTYQTNLTQQITFELPDGLSPQRVFSLLRRDHPAPFAAFINRSDSSVVSASPERFFRITRDAVIEASPIKGTRKRGADAVEDDRLRTELLTSEKDRAENTMIVDLVRNDLGRVCEFGTVAVDKLCDLEEHPTLFHLVSTVRGILRDSTTPAEILRAVFPCGSITGAPKIRTMRIIDELEPASRGLSMGAIGCYLPESFAAASDAITDVSVAIRTMVIRDGIATFNVGGGIVIDSDPEQEYAESVLKAQALLNATGAELVTE